ncbi:unnamed protein product [Echinostoma caproni]|uniref:Uncharacterized protein n=1 Tax=Echinostoma caproni TaxID=27848 RepID=A0A183B7N7_9TREM|nr:unnamed protein product [Echinostoma caproni]
MLTKFTILNSINPAPIWELPDPTYAFICANSGISWPYLTATLHLPPVAGSEKTQTNSFQPVWTVRLKCSEPIKLCPREYWGVFLFFTLLNLSTFPNLFFFVWPVKFGALLRPT